MILIMENNVKKEEKSKKNNKEVKQTKKVSYKTSKDIPYYRVTITCACGAEFETGSTQESIRVDICSACHPFFTGENRILDTEGRIEKFRKKYAKISENSDK